MPFSLYAVTLGIATVGWVQRAEEANERYGCFGDLIARVPFSMVSAACDAETIAGVALAVGEKAVEFGIGIRMCPWSVIVIRLSAVEQSTRAELLRHSENGPRKVIHSEFHFEEVLGKLLKKLDVGRSSRAIVADLSVIGTFLVIQSLHKF